MSGSGAFEFARVDLVSNHTVFPNPEHYQALLHGEDLPASTFSSFIHEATHHWCFISPVGTALSALYCSVARRALHWLATGDESETMAALDDLCAYEIALSWLRPLNEGLALFAEYDVFPDFVRPPRLISPPLEAALDHLFHLGRRVGGVERPALNYHEVADEIAAWRLDTPTLKRKAELLLTPIGSANDAYLIGYLMVKQLWRNGSRFYPELQNADVFMMFLRRFVYGDHALVRDLLDRGENPFARALRFARNLYARLHALRMMLFEDEVPWSEWERLLGPPPLEQRPGFALSDSVPFAALDTQEESEDGMRMLSRELTEVSRPLELADSELGEHIPKDHFANVVRERYLMWAGTAGARWISLGPRKGRVMVGDAVFVEDYDLTEASDEGLDALTADIYFDLYEGYRLTTLGGDDGVFGFVSDRPLSDWAKRELRSTRLDRRRIAVLDDVVREVLIRYADHTSFREGMEGFWQDGARELLEGSYTQIAFDFDDAARDAVIGRGFAGLFDADPDLVWTVTAISIAASARMSPERLADVCPQLVLPPRDAIERVRSLWPGQSPAPVGEDGDGFLTSTI